MRSRFDSLSLRVNFLFFFIKNSSYLLKSTSSIIFTYFCYFTNVTISSSWLILFMPFKILDFLLLKIQQVWVGINGFLSFRRSNFFSILLLELRWELSYSNILLIKYESSGFHDSKWIKYISADPIPSKASMRPPISPKKSRGPYICLLCSMTCCLLRKLIPDKKLGKSSTS